MKIVVSYRGISQSPDWATGDLAVKAFRDFGHEVIPYAKYYQEDRWVEGRPELQDVNSADLLVYVECNDGDDQYFELKNQCETSVCWFFDTSYYPDHLTGLANHFDFDHQFIANPLNVARFSNGYYLPYACDPEVHGRGWKENKPIDIALIGSDREDRRQLIRSLNMKGVPAKLISGVFREEYIDALSDCKFVINQNPDAGRGLLNMRHYEARAAGAVLIEQESDLSHNSPYDSSILSYSSIDDIAKHYHYMMEYGEWTMIAKRQQKAVFKHDTYRDRCETILEIIK